ncbi:UNVERIFIED_CONTAM: plasmodesmata callose-binding protein 3 [Sesamum radiatum]|uniref:Plasmodesmata callose-binding protein 3 n=1 Tax=Sesamum radiatum TaxID=300843 RepID=A0AAW2PJT2_SESRA
MAAPAPSSGTWCVCKEGLSDGALQKTLDYACGAGADCNPIHQSAPCFNPNTVRAHCSYAVNSYFQKYRQAPIACDFSGTASVVTSDPSQSSQP